VADQGFAQRLDRVVLVGFSQGSIMALDALVSGRWPVRAVVAFAGRLASPEPFASASDSDVLLVHGDADPVMPVALSAQAEAALARAGYRARRHVVPGADTRSHRPACRRRPVPGADHRIIGKGRGGSAKL
jgi:phospholipase/carboxylesterase